MSLITNNPIESRTIIVSAEDMNASWRVRFSNQTNEGISNSEIKLAERVDDDVRFLFLYLVHLWEEELEDTAEEVHVETLIHVVDDLEEDIDDEQAGVRVYNTIGMEVREWYLFHLFVWLCENVY